MQPSRNFQRFVWRFLSGCLVACGVRAQTLPISWVHASGGSGDDYGWSIAVDAEGNCYATGHSGENAVFGGQSIPTHGDYDIFLIKLNPKGMLQWVVSVGGPETDEGHSLALDSEGNIYVAGYFGGTADFGSQILVSKGKGDIFLASYNPRGQLRWLKQAGGPGEDRATGVVLDGARNIYLAGSFSDRMQIGGATLVSAGGSDAFLAKCDSAGNVLWANCVGGSANDQAERVTLDRLGNIYIVGEYGTNTFFSSPFGSMRAPDRGRSDVFLAKYTADSNLAWFRTGGGSDTDYGWDVATDFELNVCLVATTSGRAEFEGVPALAGGQTDIVAVKYSSEGALKWVRAFGGAGPDQGNAVAIDNTGNVYLTGYYIDTVTFGSTPYNAPSHADFFVLKLDLAGNVLWSCAAFGTAYSQARALTVSSRGEVFASGYFRGSTQFGPSFLTNHGDRDLFIAKIDPEPRLEISMANENAVLRWPSNPATFRLEGKESLRSTSAWRTLAPARKSSGDFNSFTNPIALPAQLFRLRQ